MVIDLVDLGLKSAMEELVEDEDVMVAPTDDREQVEALYHLLIQARSGLEKIESDSDGSTAYMHARNARIDLNEALRRVSHLLGYPEAYPLAAPDQQEPQ